MCCRRPAVRDPRPLICTSTTSTPTTVVSRSGCAASTGSPPPTCQTTSVGAEPSKPSEPPHPRRRGSWPPQDWDPINTPRNKSEKFCFFFKKKSCFLFFFEKKNQ